MNAAFRRKPQAKYRLVKTADSSPAALRRLKKAMGKVSKSIGESGRRDELLKDVPRKLRD